MQIEIPEAVVHALRLPEAEVRSRLLTELAVGLYGQGILSVGAARELCGLDARAFSQLLGERGIVRHYTSEELADDVSYARRQ
ncbi:MAG: UPF0175 family protein [Deferrisomatales bacterium]